MFSELVDGIVSKTGRGDQRQNISDYVNSAVRECDTLVHFERDMVEDQLTFTSLPATWDRPLNFRMMRTVIIGQQGYEDIYPSYIAPGRRQLQEDYYFYAAGDYFVFAGVSLDQHINIAYYQYPRRLKYYAAADRPAVYDYTTGLWTYKTATTDEDKETARNLVSNWLLKDWIDLIQEGALAKLYKNANDKDKAGPTYALFKSMQNDLLRAEPYASLDTK